MFREGDVAEIKKVAEEMDFPAVEIGAEFDAGNDFDIVFAVVDKHSLRAFDIIVVGDANQFQVFLFCEFENLGRGEFPVGGVRMYV